MKRLSLVLLVMVAMAMITSCATAATNVWLGDQVKTNSVKSTNYVQLMVQRPGTAGTGSNGLWRLITGADLINSLGLAKTNLQPVVIAGTNAIVVTNVINGQAQYTVSSTATGGGSTFNPTQFDTNGASEVQLKSGVAVTNLAAAGATTASGFTLDGGELQSDGRWLLGLESDHIDWVDAIGGASWMKLYTNGGVQLDKLTNGTLTVKTQLYVAAVMVTNDVVYPAASSTFRTRRIGSGTGSVLYHRWEQGGLNGSWEYWDAPYSNSNKLMALNVVAGNTNTSTLWVGVPMEIRETSATNSPATKAYVDAAVAGAGGGTTNFHGITITNNIEFIPNLMSQGTSTNVLWDFTYQENEIVITNAGTVGILITPTNFPASGRVRYSNLMISQTVTNSIALYFAPAITNMTGNLPPSALATNVYGTVFGRARGTNVTIAGYSVQPFAN